MIKYNDEEIAKYAKTFNSLCKKNNITSFWWDTNLLIKRDKQKTFPKIIDSIMDCYKNHLFISNNSEKFETAQSSVTNMKVGWNLGNTLDANKYRAVFNKEKNIWEENLNLTGLSTETCWHMPKTTREMIHYVKNLGFNAVRVPITWIGHLDKNNIIDSKWMARVKEVVDYVLEEEMYCIINIHHDAGGIGYIRSCESSYNQFGDRVKSIYTQMANQFSEYGEKLLFSGINEIIDENTSWADPTENASFWVNKWNQLFVDTIRSTGGKNKERNLVVMGPAGKSSKIAMEQFEMPSDSAENHLIFEFHNYDPQSFCWPQNPDGSNKNETPFWNEERDSKILEEVFNNLMTFKNKLKAPIICGEYAAWPKKID